MYMDRVCVSDAKKKRERGSVSYFAWVYLSYFDSSRTFTELLVLDLFLNNSSLLCRHLELAGLLFACMLARGMHASLLHVGCGGEGGGGDVSSDIRLSTSRCQN